MATNFKLKRSSVAGKRPALSNVQSGELALNTYDGSIFTQRDGLGISTVANLTPWYETYGGASIHYGNSVGIGTTNPLYDLDVRGSIGGFNDLRAPHRDDVITYVVTVASKDATHRYQGTGSSNGYKIDGEFSPFLVLTPGRTYKFDQSDSSNSSHPIRFYLEADKTTEYTAGVTNTGSSPAPGNSGAYTQIVVGDETPLVLHYQCTNHGYMGNAVQVNSNVVNTNYAAILRGGLNVSGAETILSSATVSDLTNTRIVYAGTSGSLENSANLTFNNNTLSVLNLDVDGLAELDDVNVSAASTFGGIVDVNHKIVGLATDNVIPFLYNNFSDLPSAGTYHGAFAHVHVRGKGYFAHGGAWYELVNKELDGTIGVGTEKYYVGVTSVSTLEVAGVSTFQGNVDVNANLDVNGSSTLTGFTTLGNNLYVAGISTFANNINGTNAVLSGNVTAVDATFSGNVSIAGTLTKQDVTNIDSVGLITARTGIVVVGGGVSIASGGVNVSSGVVTATSYEGSGIKLTGIVTSLVAGSNITLSGSTGRVTISSSGGGGGGTGGKFIENATGIHTLGNVGIGTTTASDKLTVLGDTKLDGKLKVTNLGLAGSNGQFLKSTGVGVTWSSFPTARTTGIATATAGQTSFSFTYNVGFTDVFVNGVKLQPHEFAATNGSSVVLSDASFVGDQVEFISYNTTASGAGGSSGITDVVQDTSPQLGGNLDLNSKDINGTGNITYTGNFKATGIATAATFVGNLTGNVTGNTSGSSGSCTGNSATATEATNVTVTANNSTDETVYPVFVDGATGTQGAETDTGLNYNPSTGRLTAVSYAGDGSALTGISAGVTVQDEGSALSTAGTTLNFVGSGVVASGSGATKTITIAGGGGGGSGNAGFSTAGGNFTVNAGVTTVINTFNINTNTKLSEYTVHLENVNGNIQSQKVLVMNYGAGIGLTAYSSEYGIMFHPNQIADIGVVVNAGICSLTATTKSGITGITTFSLTRQDQS